MVYLVGAGPGDPKLITRRGEALLRRADCVIYDRLVSAELLRWTKRGCEKLYVGKDPDDRGHGQSKIQRLLVQKARAHRTVVRLKGGDPTIFGRLNEELEVLVKNRIPFEIVPGVSSIWSAAAEAGIPLTDRRLSSSVVIATGHPAAHKERAVDWKRLARGADTLVILMGRAALPAIVRRLRKVRADSEPIALIRWASRPQQEVLVSTLGQVIQDLARRRDFGPPVVAIVGKVVRLSRRYCKPKIVLTRPEEDQGELVRRLERVGADCISLPTIKVRPRRLTRKQADTLIKSLPGYDWVLFNSHHGVEILSRLVRRSGGSLKNLIRGSICAIGPRTQQALEAVELKPRLVPEEFSTAGIRAAFRRIAIRGKRILIPRSGRATGDALASELRRRGARVEEVAVYDTLFRPIPAGELKKALNAARAITFTSASTAQSFLDSLRRARLPLKTALNGAAVVAIGPATARALRQAGVRRVHLPDGSWTTDGLVNAVTRVLLA